MRAYVEAYGCTMNFGEADEARELLASRGWTLSPSPEGADLVVIATCVVVERTERRMLKRIKALSDAPRLIVTGCMATARRDAASEACPSAEFAPPGDIGPLSELIGTVGPPVDAGVDDAGYAIVPIATGCTGACAYCLTREARGALRSRPMDGVVDRFAALVASGPREVRLASQDTSVYGRDIGSSLPALLSRLLAVDGDFRIRLGMMNPGGAAAIADALSDVFADDRMFRFVHLPLQSASDEVLRRMGRGYTYADFVALVSRLREAVPDLTLSTDVIVGYPGEEDRDHRANVDMIHTLEPDIVNVTRFSPRLGTPAADAGGAVVGWKAKERSRELTQARFEVSRGRNAGLVGRRTTALATEPGRGGSTILRTDGYRQVVVPEALPLRTFHELEIVGCTPTHLVGRRSSAAATARSTGNR